MVDPNRAGPSTLVTAGDQSFLVDCGRGALMRAAAAVGAANLTALLLTHLHSDHITDLSDVITTRWSPRSCGHRCRSSDRPAPGRSSTRRWQRWPPTSPTTSPTTPTSRSRPRWMFTNTPTVRCSGCRRGAHHGGTTDHRPVEPTIAFRVEHQGPRWCWRATRCPARRSTSWPPADGCAGSHRHPEGPGRAGPQQRLRDILDYHSSGGGRAPLRREPVSVPWCSPITCRRCCRARRISGGRWRPPSSPGVSNSATICTGSRCSDFQARRVISTTTSRSVDPSPE